MTQAEMKALNDILEKENRRRAQQTEWHKKNMGTICASVPLAEKTRFAKACKRNGTSVHAVLRAFARKYASGK